MTDLAILVAFTLSASANQTAKAANAKSFDFAADFMIDNQAPQRFQADLNKFRGSTFTADKFNARDFQFVAFDGINFNVDNFNARDSQFVAFDGINFNADKFNAGDVQFVPFDGIDFNVERSEFIS